VLNGATKHAAIFARKRLSSARPIPRADPRDISQPVEHYGLPVQPMESFFTNPHPAGGHRDRDGDGGGEPHRRRAGGCGGALSLIRQRRGELGAGWKRTGEVDPHMTERPEGQRGSAKSASDTAVSGERSAGYANSPR